MPDPEKFVRPKEELRISAASWNGLMQVLRDYRRGGKNGRKLVGGPQSSLLKSNIEVYVQNLTSFEWEEPYKIVRLSNSLLDLNSDTTQKINKDPVLGAFLPIFVDDPIAITQRPSGASPSSGLIVPAVVMGITVVRVRMLSPSHTWANPVEGEIDFMESSAECGQARILYHVAEESGDLSIAIVNLIGAGPCDTTTESGSGGGSFSDGPGWIAGLCPNNWLKMRVMEIHGFCSGIDNEQVILLENISTTTWASICDFVYCSADPVSGEDECVTRGPVEFIRDSATGLPKANINGVVLFYHRAANGWIEFAGGQELCAGCPEPEYESADCNPADITGGTCCGPNGGCGSNYFIVRFECSDPVIPGWDCPGWYCTSSKPACCSGEQTVMFVDGDDATDQSIVICTGPYETEEEAIAVCGPFNCDVNLSSGTNICTAATGTAFDSDDYCYASGFTSGDYLVGFHRTGSFVGADYNYDVTLIGGTGEQTVDFYSGCSFDSPTGLIGTLSTSNTNVNFDLPEGSVVYWRFRRHNTDPPIQIRVIRTNI